MCAWRPEPATKPVRLAAHGQKCGLICFDNRQDVRVCVEVIATMTSNRPFIVRVLVYKEPPAQPLMTVDCLIHQHHFYRTIFTSLPKLESQSHLTFFSSCLRQDLNHSLYPLHLISFHTMAPSAQNPVSPSANTLQVPMRQWYVGNRRDLYTMGLSECNVIATWTAEGITTLMHVTGADYNTCITNLANHIHNTPGTIYVIAAAGPDNATQNWFIDSWYTPLKTAVLASHVLTPADKARIRWVAPDFNLLKTNVAAGLRGTFALLENGRYGPSNAPPRPASSSSSSSGSSFGNMGTLSAARPGQSPPKGGSPPRPSTSGSGKGAPAGKTAAPAKKVAAAPAKRR